MMEKTVKTISFTDHSFVPASHENPLAPGC